MKYAQHRSDLGMNGDRSSKSNGGNGWIFGVIGFFVVVILAFVLVNSRRGGAETLPIVESDEVREDQIQNQDQNQSQAQLQLEGELQAQTEEIILDYLGDSEYVGKAIARRGTEDDLFTYVIVADLPAIDTKINFYEGWLIKPGVIEFFSTGEMFARADGKWGLVWEKKCGELENLNDFSHVTITLEDRDGDDAPSSIHMLEGDF